MSEIVQIDKSAFKAEAATHFKQKASQLIRELCRCWPHMIQIYLEKLNRSIEAGRVMGVTSVTTFSSEEIKQIALELDPLAELEMREQVREILLPIMRGKGFSDEFLSSVEPES